jgi:hypothetical protein
MNRRAFLKLAGGLSSIFGAVSSMHSSEAQTSKPPVNLLSAPLEVAGDWGGSPRGDAAAVISRMREACLSGLRLLSDLQPDHLTQACAGSRRAGRGHNLPLCVAA